MKKSIFLLVFPAIAFLLTIFNTSVSAQVIVENGSRVNNYTRFDTAVNHAMSGDTLYLSELNNNIGTYSSYYGSGGFHISKQLHIFGTGIHPDSTVASGISYLQGDIIFDFGASGSSISGVYLDDIYLGQLYKKDTVTNIDINRCYITNSIVPAGAWITNILIRQNICGQINCTPNGNNNANWTISNNIAYHVGYLGDNSLIANNVLIDTGTFLYSGSYYIGDIFGNNNTIIENNINLATRIDTNYNLNCTYKNNLTLVPIKNNCSACISSSNIVQHKDSLFTNFGTYDMVNNKSQLIRYNFHLKTGCKGIGAGSDGNDIGIYGGLYPWKDGDLPVNPHILSKSIGTTLDASGKLKVNVTVEAQQK